MDTQPSLLDRLHNPEDSAAWNRFLELYRPWIERWIRRLDPDVHLNDLDDLVHDVLTLLLQKIHTFQRQQMGSFRHWLRWIIVNRLREFWRKRNRFPETPAGERSPLDEICDANSSLARQWDAEHDHYVLHRALELLANEFSAERMEAFRLLFFEEQSPEEVAQKLGKTVNAVWVDKSRVLNRLRQEIWNLIE
jgi:RNA polymerase sigma-70 factor, ECF subfamily